MSCLGDEGRASTFAAAHAYGVELADCGSGGNVAARALASDEKRGIGRALIAMSPDTPRFVDAVPGGVVEDS